MDADEIIRQLELKPHPEGGHFRETWRHHPEDGGRGAGTAIFHLLKRGEFSHWHRVDSAEIFHFYAGSPLELRIQASDGAIQTRILGSDLAAGQLPQIVIPPGAWQRGCSLGEWSLIGCTVSPAFEFEHFELAPPGWEP